jgi:ribosomal protein S18 acetylase RimI-like enzyme
MKMGLKMVKRAQKMKIVFEPIEADRKTNMQERAYIYLMIIGVGSEFQGQGFGGKLLRVLIEESEQAGLPIYLETETESNVSMYEKFGFSVLHQITLPVVDLPMWEMIREPKA